MKSLNQASIHLKMDLVTELALLKMALLEERDWDIHLYSHGEGAIYVL